jgi:hypothetical protein
MEQISVAGMLLISGFLLVMAASFAGPPRLYQEANSQEQLQLIEEYPNRWLASNVLFALAGLATAVGLILFTFSSQGEGSALISWLAALAYALGTLFWIFFLANRFQDPAQLFENYSFSPFTVALFGLLIIGLLLYGIAFLQAGYPGWLGYGTAGLVTVIGLLAVVIPGTFFKWFPPQTLYFFTLAAGIALLIQ